MGGTTFKGEEKLPFSFREHTTFPRCINQRFQ